MKKFFYAIVAMAALHSCSKPSFTLNGEINPSRAGKTVYLKDYKSDAIIDSTTISKEGLFSFTGSVEKPSIYAIQINNVGKAFFIIENEELTLSLTQQKPMGGTLNAINESMEQELSKVNKKYKALMRSAKTDEAQVKAQAEMIEETNAIASKYIEQNKDNIIPTHIVVNILADQANTAAQLDSITNIIPESKEFASIKELQQMFINKENTSTGDKFTDFKGLTTDGKEISLSDYVGKGEYVLMDFWASWCGPCRAEIPNLKNIYNKFKGKGFNIVSVNVWDQESYWKKSLATEKMDWTQIRANEDATTKYGVRSIPTILLIDPNGVIVERDIRGEYIMELVSKELDK